MIALLREWPFISNNLLLLNIDRDSCIKTAKSVNITENYRKYYIGRNSYIVYQKEKSANISALYYYINKYSSWKVTEKVKLNEINNRIF